ncbi:MAG: hypothetical protein M5U34_16955 [Chloroflexi bacterium]|nr:hypothetical protein [Chloroflexota bacterium]
MGETGGAELVANGKRFTRPVPPLPYCAKTAVGGGMARRGLTQVQTPRIGQIGRWEIG